jgi:hypothetical protein
MNWIQCRRAPDTAKGNVNVAASGEVAVKDFERSLRIMSRDRALMHVFSIGKDSSGKDWACIVTLMPEDQVAKLPLVDSEPLEAE